MSDTHWSEHVLEGFLAPEQSGQYYNIPFEMPARVRRLDVRYEYSQQVDSDPHITGGNTLDIGLFDQRGADYPGRGFRGWTGSARQAFFITPHDATPGYLPGPLDPGVWHISLGFYKSAPEGCHYTVTLRFEHGDTDQPPVLPRMLTLANSHATLQARANGWYRGELHCHSYHSDGDASPREMVDFARSLGLDFLAVTDHNAISHLVDLAALDPGDLVLIPGCEVTTYKGHWNVWGLDEWIDFRTLTPDLMRQSIRRAVDLGYLTSCNHPRRMGPPWEFTEVTGTHCVEVWNGPWHIFNSDSLSYWESRLRAGERLVAVGGSDGHYLHRPHIARIGTPTMWIHCPEPPTAANLLAALRSGHAFISDAPDGPQLYLGSADTLMGDTVARPPSGTLEVRVRAVNGAGLQVALYGAGGPLADAIISSDDQMRTFSVPVGTTPYVRAELVDPGSDPRNLRALTNPIYLE